MTSRLLFAVMLASCLMLMGCQSAAVRKPLPQYEWVNARQAASLINQRATSVDTLFVVGELTLTEPGKNRSVTMDVALLTLGKNYLRLRAWKMNQPVFDLTLTPDGLWTWSDARAPQLPMTAPHIRQIIGALRGEIPDNAVEASADTQGTPSSLVYRSTLGPELAPFFITIDKPTLTVRQYRFQNDKRQVRQTIELSDYDLIDYLPWPRRIIATGEQGVMRIDVNEVQINSTLPPNAFVPSPRATKQP